MVKTNALVLTVTIIFYKLNDLFLIVLRKREENFVHTFFENNTAAFISSKLWERAS